MLFFKKSIKRKKKKKKKNANVPSLSDHHITRVNNEICPPIRWVNKKIEHGISGIQSHMEHISGQFD